MSKDVEKRIADTINRTLGNISHDLAERQRIGGYARAVAEAETVSTDGRVSGGTGQTILRLAEKKGLMRLVAAKQIGKEELIAADEIQTGFTALSAPAALKGASLMKIDGGGLRDGLPWTAHVQHIVRQYTRWANHWSARAKLGDPTFRIVLGALIGERSFGELDREHHVSAGRSARALINGLRDYCGRFGKVDQDTGKKWLADAETFFARRLNTTAAALAA